MGMNSTERKELDQLRAKIKRLGQATDNVTEALKSLIKNYSRVDSMVRMIVEGEGSIVKAFYDKQENEHYDKIKQSLKEAGITNPDSKGTKRECIQPEDTGANEGDNGQREPGVLPDTGD